jgi:TolB-like protein
MQRDQVAFGSFVLNPVLRTLSHAGAPIKLGSRAMDILCVLASANGEPVSKDVLMARVWPGVIVEENNIQVHVSALRKALDENAAGESFVATIPGRGYRLLGVKAAGDARLHPMSQRPSIAVLPFENMSSDPEQDYFADGMVEDIVSGLSRIKWLSVIARSSTFSYKGKAVDIRQVGRDLEVRFLLQGSVRKSANTLRITAQLIDAERGAQLWTERYDRPLGDVFAIQDEIAMSVIGAIKPGLRKIEIERVKRSRPESLDAYDLTLQALPFIYKLMPGGSAPAIPLLNRALELEPDYSFAHAALSWCLHVRFGRGGLDENDRLHAIRHALLAVSGGSDDATTLAVAALVIWFDSHEVNAAFDLFDRALAISPSSHIALCASSVALAWSGRSELAIERAQRALQLSPFDSLTLAHQGLAGAYCHLERYEEACSAARRAIESNPAFSVPYTYLTAALVRLGKHEEATSTARMVLNRDHNFSISRFAVTVGVAPEVFSGFADAWRAAGLPD